MDLLSYNTEDLTSLRPNDYFFEPASRKIYQYRNKEGKAIIVREIGSSNITKLLKSTLKTVLKVDGDFDKYQVINISDTSVTLFNSNIGETFEVGFGDASDSMDEMRTAFNKGDEVVADIFDYDDIKEIIKLSVASASQSQESAQESSTGPSEAELKRIQEIEEKKAKKRPFGSSEAPKAPAKAPEKKPTPATSSSTTTKKPAKTSSKKTTAKKTTKEPAKEPPKAKEVKKAEPEKPREETKEEKKAREKREKEEQKEREKREKEEKKAREKLEKEQKKGKKGKK